MTEEEYFRKNYPDSCYGDRLLSPHWDFFQEGVEFGERESEEKIKELEQKLEQTEKDLADYQFNYPTIKELQKENAELKEQHEVSARNMSSFIESLSKSENEAKKQLTKAKEIIREFVEWATWQGSNCPNFKSIQDKAEQFLNSEVEK